MVFRAQIWHSWIPEDNLGFENRFPWTRRRRSPSISQVGSPPRGGGGGGGGMFRAVLLGRALGKSFSFPVDTSSRAFRRARSETLPFEQLDLSSVQLKHAPIALRWRSAEEPLSRGQAPRAEAVETGVSAD